MEGNNTISDAEKMTYLKSHLKGDASRAIAGLSLTHTNYTIAVDILKNRFGRKQNIRNAYMDILVNLLPARNEAKFEKFLFQTIEAYIHGLEAVSITHSYESLLSLYC